MISLVVCLLFTGTIWPQQVTIRQTTIQNTSWASGPQMYQEYCAACHGNKADGRGPAARLLNVSPADLTALAQRNQGKFPYDKFDSAMRFGAHFAAHASGDGSKAMPVWGPLFRSLPGQNDAVIHQRIFNLAQYVASLQAKQ
jgi:mono/diheme cytochrome c family protein